MAIYEEDEERALEYIEQVFDKITILIKSKIWGSNSIERFKEWKSQFTTVREQYYAAYLAQKLIYYNSKDFIALISYSFAQSIEQIAININNNQLCFNDKDWKNLITKAKYRTLVCPLTIDSPASSSYMVCRLLRNQGMIPEDQLCATHDELIQKLKRQPENYDAIIFVDDMIGSGDQFKKSYTVTKDFYDKEISLQRYLYDLNPNIKTFLSLAVAPKKIIEELELETKLTINVAEKLTHKHEVNNREFWLLNEFVNGMDFLNDLQNNVGLPIEAYKENSWVIAFDHGTPDNTSPFYWYESRNWNSIVRSRGEDI